MSISIDLKGVDKTLDKLKKLGVKGRMAAVKVVTVGTLRIHRDVIDSLGTDGKSGAIRMSHGSPHQASAPGEAPSSDTGELRKGITFNVDTAKIEGTIRSKAPYSLDLELGTHNMEPRPFLVPAFYRNLPAINQDSQEAWRTAMNE